MAKGWLAGLEQALNVGAALVQQVQQQAQQQAQQLALEQARQRADAADFGRDVALMSGWYETLDAGSRPQALAAHLAQLTPSGRAHWLASLRQMHANVVQRIQEHEARANQAWGGSFEDRMAYGMAQLRTGQSDPAHQRQLAEYQGQQAYVEQLLAASAPVEPAAPEPTPPEPPAPFRAEAVKAAIQEMTRTGFYPGGPEQMRKDIMALIESGESDEVMALLERLGANDGGNRVLNIGDHYRPGTQLYELRWPVAFALPMPFEALDRPTQFSVLFGEWTRREAEAACTRNQGDNASAQFIYEECLARAQQIEVPELIARSHEGLASVAAKLNQRAAERQHLQRAMAARDAAT